MVKSYKMDRLIFKKYFANLTTKNKKNSLQKQ